MASTTTAHVLVKEATTENPVAGKQVKLEAKALAGSGGHIHTANRPDGIFLSSGSNILTATTNGNGEVVTTYRTSGFGGEEKITASLVSDPGTQDDSTVKVKVSGLVELPAGSNYTLVGAEVGKHTQNHFGVPELVNIMPTVAQTFNQLFIIPEIEYVKDTGFFVYSYKITNNKNSSQSMIAFGLNIKSDETFMLTPPGWQAIVAISGDFSGWGVITASDLFPKQTLSGFSIKSTFLPDIITSYSQGRTDLSRWPSHEDLTKEEKIELVKRETFPNDYAQGKTVGPGLDPSSMSPTQIVDHLIAQKHAAFKLGWITNQGIVNSLDKKLDQVKNHLSKGQAKTAKNVLSAFTQELQAQRGKQVTENA